MLGLCFGQPREVRLRHDEEVRRRPRRDVFEDHHVVVLMDELRRNLLLDDLAEKTVGRVAHVPIIPNYPETLETFAPRPESLASIPA